MPRTVVITGIGTACGFGVGIDALWAGLVEGRSCLQPIARFDATGFRCRLAGEVPNFAGKDYVPKHYRKAVKVMARDTELAVAAAKMAVDDAKIVTRASLGDPDDAAAAGGGQATTYPCERMGCSIGAGLIAAETDELTAAFATAKAAAEGDGLDLAAWGSTGMDNLTPLWMLKYLPNMLACHVTILHGAEGPSNTITCAEASGLLSIGESARVIQRDAADLCFTGGGESKVNYMGLLRMDLAGRLVPTGDAASGGSLVRPYEPDAKGTILGEGAGILIVEEEAAAKARGARAYARIAGFGAGHSDTWYAEAGEGGIDEGYRAAIENALDDASCRGQDIDAVFPLASGVPEQDRAELGAIEAALGGTARAGGKIAAITPQVGCAMAGAGGLLAAVGAKCLAEQMLPRGFGKPAERRSVRRVLVCSGSLGGQNAAIVLERA